ncbi:exo-beta-N-acetylmuramidase NamZ family protein [Nakamurella lactea]|uniref:exo-beta-N-acetylmuramidase NamZ family protein n=1 Tax=Nakamurella lactea TaxID=459515 RepID=UPI0003FB4CAC|nr:DUF1343 domain-containing protein [Nakamurella lactea]
MAPLDRRTFLRAAGISAAAVPLAPGLAGAVTAPADPATQGPQPNGHSRVRTGADVLAAQNFSPLSGTKVGIITNPTGIGADLRSIVDAMHASGAVDIVGVFGPEHGFRGTAQAGESEETYVDPRTGLTVYDAYGATVDKLVGMFTTAGVQTVVFDIQDAGARFYTYIWTMYTAMKAAVAVDANFVVLDRPNPTGGVARGPLMTDAYTSGVGAEAIVQAHGMTVGELAGYLDGEILPTDTDGKQLRKLTVVKMRGWRPSMRYADTGLPWVPPSPNMPTPDTALLYPGTGMFEGLWLSEGRGTTRPFELIGAPDVDYRWAETLAARNIPGVGFREAYFTPTFSKFVGEVCGGVQVQITDPAKLDPIRVAVEMMVAAKALYPGFGWRYDSYDPVRPHWIDKLTGSTRLREQISGGASADEVIGSWRDELSAFDHRRRQYLLYPGRRA